MGKCGGIMEKQSTGCRVKREREKEDWKSQRMTKITEDDWVEASDV